MTLEENRIFRVRIYEWDSPRWSAYLELNHRFGPESSILLTQSAKEGERDLFSFALDFEEGQMDSLPVDRREYPYVIISGAQWLKSRSTTNMAKRIIRLEKMVSSRIYGLLLDFDIKPSIEEFCFFSSRERILPNPEEIGAGDFERILKMVAEFVKKQGEYDTLIPIDDDFGFRMGWTKYESDLLIFSGNQSSLVREDTFEEDINRFCAQVLRENGFFLREEILGMAEFGRRVGPDSGDVSVLLQAMGFHSFFQMPNYRQWIVENASGAT